VSVESTSHTGFGDPLAQLERTFIDEFLRARGVDPRTLDQLPEIEAKALLKAASIYAAMKLTEVEARAHFVHEIHDGRTTV
jgi:hypothetical protein